MKENTRLLQPKRHSDERGYFCELYHRERLAEAGILDNFVQDNHSLSRMAGTLRGLHFQAPPAAQAKLVRCGRGAIFDVVLDIRIGSPTYGRWEGYELTEENGNQLYVPIGFAHGFLTLQSNSEILYKCSDYYSAESEGSIRWDTCGVDWPLNIQPILSEKDKLATKFEDLRSPFVYGENS